MAGAAKKRAKQGRSDKSTAQDTGETSARAESVSGSTQAVVPIGFDGPGDSRHGSFQEPPGSIQGQAPSIAPSHGSQPGPYYLGAVQPLLRDPARQPEYNRNIDLPGNAYNLFSQYALPVKLMRRPAIGNTSGMAATVAINSYPIVNYPRKTVFQYDVLIGSGVEKRGLIKAVWASQAVKKVIDHTWIFDGNRIAWALQDKPNEVVFTVDLDLEKGLAPRQDRPNHFRVTIRKTGVVNLAMVQAYLDGKVEFDNSVLEAINFLDHLIREVPSKNMIALKRSFFHPTITERTFIGGGIEAFKGVYQSIRAAQGGRLVVNVDVSNSTFWGPWKLHMLAAQNSGAEGIEDFAFNCRKVQHTLNGPWVDHVYMIKLRKLKKIRFTVSHRGHREANPKVWIVKDFSYLNSKQWVFDLKDKTTGTVKKDTSIFDYFQMRYNIHLQYYALPIVETTKKGVAFPMEVCNVIEGQRYPYKLDEKQTASMIKFAVTRPAERKKNIEGGLKLLDWGNDPFLKGYQLQIQPTMLETQARLLTPPTLEFGNKRLEKPMYSGRWRLDGKQFLTTNRISLESWGVCIFNQKRDKRTNINKTQAEVFIRNFLSAYKAHGGHVLAMNPAIMFATQDVGECIESFYHLIGNTFNKVPQMMVFMLDGKDSFQYLRIKKSSDCRWGVMSQCVQTIHVMRSQAQYISNVLMKFNAKMGGTTNRIATKNPSGHFKVPTIVIGADVSHASPGSMQPSMAAVTVSMDKLANRYAAACETNGHRVEMISTFNLEEMLTPLFREWMMNIGAGRAPKHIFYMRDGVSEGQFQHVLQQEVRDIKHIWEVLCKDDKTARTAAEPNKSAADLIKFTVIIASKRHHIRFFPKGKPAADNNGNPCPGVLVEKDVTHPFEYDFYLNSHSAIQGTARPTHYHVLIDDSNMSANDLQNMIYEQCYQYIRSTTPVSLHPAVYYAHLASARAKSHENIPVSEGPHKSDEERKAHEKAARVRAIEAAGGMMTSSEAEKHKPPTETKPLIPMKNKNGIRWGMWYI